VADTSSQPVPPTPQDLNSSINCSQDKEALCSELKNPLDALQILAEAAVVDQDSSSNSVLTPESFEGEYKLGARIEYCFLTILKPSLKRPARLERQRQVLNTTNW